MKLRSTKCVAASAPLKKLADEVPADELIKRAKQRQAELTDLRVALRQLHQLRHFTEASHRKSTLTITTIGLDIAKSIFQLHGVDAVDKWLFALS